MDRPDITAFNREEIERFVSKASIEEIESSIAKFSAAQIFPAIQKIDAGNDLLWKKKIRAAILGLNSRPQLEVAGKSLSLKQLIELIDHTLQIEDKHHWKLSPLLVGMTHEQFSQFLYQATQEHIHLLQCDSATEPVQHHLTTLSHEMSMQIDKVIEEIDMFSNEINQLKPDQITQDDLSEITHRIDLYRMFFERLLEKANKALAIAWNTTRMDLIESFNKIKDSCNKYLIYGTGKPKTKTSAATGLYAALENKLFTVFGDPNNPSDPEAVKDNEPAIEALVKFSIWYIRDYWELGLLPSIKNLDHSKHTEEELFSKVQENLIKVGLSTVKDLKNAGIYSKKTLKEYLSNKR